MSNLVKRPWLLLPLLLLTLQSSWGQAPSGTNYFAFSSPSLFVYDLQGTYEDIEQNIIGAGGTLTPLSIQGMALTHDRSGRLIGKGLIYVTVGSDGPGVAAFYTANGHVSGGGNNPVRVQLSVHLSGSGVVEGVQTSFSISIRYDFTVDPGSMSLVGTAKGRASFTNLSGGRIDESNVHGANGNTGGVPIPSGAPDGSWSVQLQILAGNQLKGSGNIVLSDGRSLPVHVSGSYIPVSGRSILRLTGYMVDGDNDGRGSMVRLTLFPDGEGNQQVDTVNGSILGQKVVQ